VLQRPRVRFQRKTTLRIDPSRRDLVGGLVEVSIEWGQRLAYGQKPLAQAGAEHRRRSGHEAPRAERGWIRLL
jgi:hypothetical protein